MTKEVSLKVETRCCNNRCGHAVVNKAGEIVAGPFHDMPLITYIQSKGEVILVALLPNDVGHIINEK